MERIADALEREGHDVPLAPEQKAARNEDLVFRVYLKCFNKFGGMIVLKTNKKCNGTKGRT